MRYHNQSGVDSKRYSRKNGNVKLSPHFQLSEFACKDGSDTVLVHTALLYALEEIRQHFGRPVVINSAYRTPEHNRKVGGAANSYHVRGMAADIRIEGVTPEDVARHAEQIGLGGLGRYRTFTHVDCGKANRRWRG